MNITTDESWSIRLDTPAYLPYICGWRVFGHPEGAPVCVDIVTASSHNMHMVWLSPSEIVYGDSTEFLYITDNLPGTTYFALGGRAYLGVAALEGSQLSSTVELNISVCAHAGKINLFDQFLCQRHNVPRLIPTGHLM